MDVRRSLQHFSALWALVLGALAPAQNTWIVDANRGPGWHFDDLPPAVAAAAPGDRLVLRWGNYRGAIVTKGLTIEQETTLLGSAICFITSDLRIQDLPVGHRVLIRGLHFGLQFFILDYPASLVCFRNAGTIHLERCQVRGWNHEAGLLASSCALVTAKECTFTSACTLRDSANICTRFGRPGIWGRSSNLHFERCEVSGESATYVNQACDLEACFATFVNCKIRGADYWCYYDMSCLCTRWSGQPSEAIQAALSTVAILGEDTTLRGGQMLTRCCPPCPPAPVPSFRARAWCSVIRATAVPFTSSGPLSETVSDLPVLEARLAREGHELEVLVAKGRSDPLWLAIGAPATRVPDLGLGLWLQLNAHLVIVGARDVSQVRIPIPKGLPQSLVVGIQGGYVGPSWSGTSAPTFTVLP